MQQQIKEKLCDSQGHSMLLALLFLLVCITVGSIVLTAASVGSRQIADNREQQQNYFAVMSAARLLAEEVQEMSATFVYQEIVTTNYWVDEEGNAQSSVTITYAQGAPKLESHLLQGLYAEDLAGILQNVWLYYEGPAELKNALPLQHWTQPLTLEADKAEIPKVTGTMTVLTSDEEGGQYQGMSHFSIVLTLQDEQANNQVKMLVPVRNEQISVQMEQGGNTVTYTYQLQLQWDAPLIRKGAL